MKQFLKMLAVVQEQGGVISFDPTKTGKEPENWCWTNDELGSQFFPMVAKKAQVFVFAPKNFSPVEIEPAMLKFSSEDMMPLHTEDQPLPDLDMPFETIAIEMIDGPITSPRPDDKAQVYIDCILVHEEPRAFKNREVAHQRKMYWVWVLTRMVRSDFIDGESHAVHLDVAFEVPNQPEDGMISMFEMNGRAYVPNVGTLRIVEQFLLRLNTEAAGQERVPTQRVKVRSGGHKEIVKIKRIIHISPKRTEKSYAKETGRVIEWSHRWFSRGHWRYSTPEAPIILGKDRDGNYTEPGRTWVTESIKGPEHKELISKTRLVE